MSNAKNYQEKLPVITAIENPLSPTIPVDVYLQEGENLYHWSLDDKSKLADVGLDAALIDDLPVRAGALREAQSLWMKERHLKEEAQKEWTVKSPAAYELHDDLISDFRYAYRKREDAMTKVRAIADGSGHMDMIQDLNDLSVFGKENPEELEKVKFDMTRLELAAEMSNEMADLLGRANGESKSDSKEKVIRDQAFTHMKEAVDEIMDCGKYVFRKDKVRLKGYRSEYYRKH